MSTDFDFEEPAAPPKPVEATTTESETIERPPPKCHYTEPVDFSQNTAANTVYRFSLPPVPRDTILHQLKVANAGVIPNENTAEFKVWKDTVSEAVENYTVDGLYQSRLDDQEADFAQGIRKPDGSLLGMASPKFRAVDGELKGELAVLKVSKKLGLGDVLSIPLPHSGIVVTIKPPTERDIIDFYNTVFREKIYLGRMSSGLTLTNLSAYINNRLFDFIIKHVHSINYSDINKDQLKNYILIHDFHVLAWGFAATMYPNGFDYQRPCTNHIDSCNYIAKATINMLKLLWVDNSSLTQVQKDILYEVRPGKLTTDSYRKFVGEHQRTKGREVSLANGLKVTLKIPTVAEHVSDGLGWVNKINNSIDNILTAEGDESEAKTEMLQQYVASSVLRQFSHFVDFIEADESVITDRDTIHSVLELLSSEDDLRKELTEAILKFKSDTTIALVGIPEYKCPDCGKEQRSEDTAGIVPPENEKLSSVIPLDVMMLFFTLLTLRMSRILERQ